MAQLLPLMLVLLTGLVVLVLMMVRLSWKRHYAAIRSERGLARDRGIELACFSASSLADSARAMGQTGLHSALPALLEIDDHRLILNTATKNAWVLPTVEFGPDVSVRLFERHGLIQALPVMVRLGVGAESHFLFVKGQLSSGDDRATRLVYDQIARRFRDHAVVRSPWPKWRGALIALPVLGMLIALMSVGALNRKQVLGPELAASDARGAVWLASNELLWSFNADGDGPERELRWADLGVRKGVTDMQFLRDGGLLIGDFASGTIKQCDLVALVCREWRGDIPRAEKAFKFRYDEDRARLLFADTDNHQVLVTDAERPRQALKPEGGFCYPNRVVLTPDGGFWVADTNSFRILQWAEPAQTPSAVSVLSRAPARRSCDPVFERGVLSRWFSGRERERGDGQALPMVMPAHLWPVDVLPIPDGGMAVLLNDGRLRMGDVVLMPASGATPRRLPLIDDTDAWALAPLGDDILVIDPVATRVQRFSAEGERKPDFADAYFSNRRALAAARQRVANHSYFAGLGLILLLVMGMIAASAWQRPKQIARLLAT